MPNQSLSEDGSVSTSSDAKHESHVDVEVVSVSAAAEIEVVDESVQSRERSYSHLTRNPQSLDSIEVNGKTYLIPATMGSNYWAILRVMYANINQPVLFEELVDGVDETMQEHDAEGWEYFCGKQITTVWKRVEAVREVKPIKSWQDRIINNAKTLCRWRDYGLRLYERGHVMRLEHDAKNGDPYFILYDNLTCLDHKKKTVK